MPAPSAEATGSGRSAEPIPGLARRRVDEIPVHTNRITNAFEDVVGSCNKCKRYGYIECPVYSTECTDSDFPYGDWYCASFEPQTTA